MSRRTTLTEAGTILFDEFTARPLLVIDTEFENIRESGTHLISIAIVPVIAGNKTRRAQHLYKVVNPGVAIRTTAIHGFTAADLIGKPDVNAIAKLLLAKLNHHPDAIVVSHTPIDGHVLRTELTRLDERAAAGETGINAGIADLPNLPILDTSALASAVEYPGAGNRRLIRLPRLAELTGVTIKGHHHAQRDAEATASILLELLAHAAQTEKFWTIEEILDAASGGTLHAPKGPSHLGGRHTPAHFAIPDTHLTRHNNPLDERVARTKTNRAVTDWVALIAECSALRCPYARDEAAVASEHNGPILIDPLIAFLSKLTEPGQAGTLLGAVHELLAPSWDGAKPAVPRDQVVAWWEKHRKAVTRSAPCDVENAKACPDCLTGRPCPRDTVYIDVGEITATSRRGQPAHPNINASLGSQTVGTVWTKKHPEIAGYVVARAIEHARAAGKTGPAGKRLVEAIDLNLHFAEPRLALQACESLLDHDPSQALNVADIVLRQRTSDTAYDLLKSWFDWAVNHVVTSVRQPPRVISHPRLARPTGRVNANRYAPSSHRS